MDLDEEMGPNLGVSASVQHETLHLRCVLIAGGYVGTVWVNPLRMFEYAQSHRS